MSVGGVRAYFYELCQLLTWRNFGEPQIISGQFSPHTEVHNTWYQQLGFHYLCGAQHIQTFLTLYKTCIILTTNHNNQQVHIKWLKSYMLCMIFSHFMCICWILLLLTNRYFIRIQPTQSIDSSNPNEVPPAKKLIHSTTPNIISSSKNMDAHHSLHTWQPAWKTGLNLWHTITGKLLPVSEVCIFPAKEDSLSLVNGQRVSIIQERCRTQDKLLQSGLLLVHLQYTCSDCSTTLNMPTLAASDTPHMASSISWSTGTQHHMSGVH